MYGTGRGRARCSKIHLSRYYDFARRLIFGSALILDGFKVADKARQREFAGWKLPGERVGYGKVGVIGAIERKGNVVARVIGSMDAPTLSAFVRRATDEKVTLVATDENPAYRYVRARMPHWPAPQLTRIHK